MDEQQKFREWVDTFPDRASAAEKLEISESYLFLLLSEKRPINDKFRAKWRRAGGEPEDAISEQSNPLSANTHEDAMALIMRFSQGDVT